MEQNHIRIQTYSKRILLNTPRIQDSRFKVQGKVLPGTLNLESWIRGVFNRIRLNTIDYVHGESFVLKHKEETYDLQAVPRSHEPTPCLPKAETEQTGVGTWGGGYHIYTHFYVCNTRLFVYSYVSGEKEREGARERERDIYIGSRLKTRVVQGRAKERRGHETRKG